MTKGTGVQPLLPAEMRGVDDITAGDLPGMGRMPGDMFGTRSVTALTVYAVTDAGAAEYRLPTPHLRGFGIGPMALDTLSGYLFSKIDHGRRIPGTVTPGLERD